MAKESQFRVENVFPSDIYVRLVITSKGLNQLLDFLSHSRVEFDSEEEPEMVEASRFVKDEFFPQLNALSEEIGRGGYGS